MKIRSIAVFDDYIEVVTDARDGEPLHLIYRGDVAHQFQVDRDGQLIIALSVTPRPDDQPARMANRTRFDR